MSPLRSRRRSGAAPFPTAVVPRRCHRLADALISGLDELDSATAFATDLAVDGEALDVCLADLDETYLAVDGDAAPPAVVRAAALAWASTMQEHYNCLTCADPLTGLASIQHLQSQVATLYRSAEAGWLADADISRSHTLAVIEFFTIRVATDPKFDELENALRHATAVELLHELLPEAEQAAKLHPHRLVVTTRQTQGLPERLTVLADRLNQRLLLSPKRGHCRVWTEALPNNAHSASRLLDELAR